VCEKGRCHHLFADSGIRIFVRLPYWRLVYGVSNTESLSFLGRTLPARFSVFVGVVVSVTARNRIMDRVDVVLLNRTYRARDYITVKLLLSVFFELQSQLLRE